MSFSKAIVVPCYNETARFDIFYWKEMILSNNDILWIFADDGSSDGTYQKLLRLGNTTNLMIIRFIENQGKGETIRKAWRLAIQNNSSLECIAFIDADGAFAINDVKRFFALFTNFLAVDSYKILISSRVALSGRNVIRRKYRHFLGRIVATFLTNKWKNSPYDTQCGFKIFKVNSAFLASIQAPFHTRWFFDIEIFLRLNRLMMTSMQVWEEPVNYWKDVDGSKLNLRQMVKTVPEIFWIRNEIGKNLGFLNDH